jgi:hypothetical protein
MAGLNAMFSLLSTDRCTLAQHSSVWEYKQMVDKQKKPLTEGMDKVAEAYRYKAGSAEFARATGFGTQQALSAVRSRGSASPPTIDRFIKATKVSRSWLFDRVGEMFPDGMNTALFREAQSGSDPSVDVDVLRNMIHALAAVVTASARGAGPALLSAMDKFEYSDRGFYLDVKKTIQDAAARVGHPIASPGVEPGATSEPAKRRGR